MGKFVPPPPSAGAPAWMLTFGDMISLLLVFFVLLVSMMVIDPKKFVEVLGTFADAGGSGYDKPEDVDPVKKEDYFKQIIRTSARRNTRPDGGEVMAAEGDAVRVHAVKDNYVVQVAETGFFADMSIELSDPAKSALDRIADIIRRTGLNRVLLHGHYAEAENPDSFMARAVPASINGKSQDVLVRKFERFDPNAGPRGAMVADHDKFLTHPKELAMWRAQAVKEYLMFRGVPAKNLQAIDGGMLGKVIRSGIEQRVKSMKGGVYQSPTTGVVREGSAEARGPDVEMTKGLYKAAWPQFIFVEGGGDAGRTVSISVSGEVVSEDGYIAPLGKD